MPRLLAKRCRMQFLCLRSNGGAPTGSTDAFSGPAFLLTPSSAPSSRPSGAPCRSRCKLSRAIRVAEAVIALVLLPGMGNAEGAAGSAQVSESPAGSS